MLIDMPPGEVIDRLAVLYVKSKNISDKKFRIYSKVIYTDFKIEVKKNLKGKQFDFKLHKCFRSLIKFHSESWTVLDEIEVTKNKEPVDLNIFFSQAKVAHALNMMRREQKNIINTMFESAFVELSSFPEFVGDTRISERVATITQGVNRRSSK